MGVFIAWPWLAAIPGAFFLALYHFSGRRLTAGTGVAWLLYLLYEYGMKRRWLCSGECNIRVDLLLLYPVLLVISGAAVATGIRDILRRRRTSAPG